MRFPTRPSPDHARPPQLPMPGNAKTPPGWCRAGSDIRIATVQGAPMGIGKDCRPHEGFRMIPDRMLLDHRLQAIDVRLWGILLFVARGRPELDSTDAALADKLGTSDR